MSTPSKPRVIKDFEKLDGDIQERIKLEYPRGFHRHLINFSMADGRKVSALPFETEDHYYMVRMSVTEAKQIIEKDDDYDDDGILRDDIQSEYEEKYDDEIDLDQIADIDDDED
ncbi:MAG: hypothetical protein R3275_05880 [Saprospiraceae bacterium]|nr:hypothetical protein [Saprospiraceae bacterium]